MTIRFDILTLFPEAIEPYLKATLLGKATQKGLLSFNLHYLRNWATDKHHRVDDSAYGGGEGMVLKVDPLAHAIEAISKDYQKGHVIALSPQGRKLNHQIVSELSSYRELLLICGRYEGIDQRVLDGWVDEEISLGDFVLCGGELPALSVVEAVARLTPGVVGKEKSVEQDSFVDGCLEYPQYTRPEEFRGMKVPEVLLNGNHASIARWRREQSLRNTLLKRPDLLKNIELSEEDRIFLRSLGETC